PDKVVNAHPAVPARSGPPPLGWVEPAVAAVEGREDGYAGGDRDPIVGLGSEDDDPVDIRCRGLIRVDLAVNDHLEDRGARAGGARDLDDLDRVLDVAAARRRGDDQDRTDHADGTGV